MANDQTSEAAKTASAADVENIKPAANQGLKAKIQKQVEYYFDDINLPRDRFLQQEMKNDNGWIPLDVMLKFNRLLQLSSDKELIADSLAHSDLIEVSEDKEKIRRNPEVPLPDNTLEYWQEIKTRTAYVKGFPQTATLDEIQSFLSQAGEVKNVMMRRTKAPERVFKGSVFATFPDVITAKAFVDNPTLATFHDAPLVKKLQDQYWQDKKRERQEKVKQEKAIKADKKKKTAKDSERARAGTSFVKGSLLKVTGLPTDKEVNALALKQFLVQYGPIGFVEKVIGGETTVRINASKEDEASVFWKNACEKQGSIDDTLDYEGHKLKATVLEGEEEQQFWIEFTKRKVIADEREQHRAPKHKKGKGRDEKGGKLKAKESQGPRGAKRAPEDGPDDEVPKKSKRIVFNEAEDNGDDDSAEGDDSGEGADEVKSEQRAEA